jgi:hypothetical protein
LLKNSGIEFDNFMRKIPKYKRPSAPNASPAENKIIFSPKQDGRQMAETVAISQPAAVGIAVTLFVLWMGATYLLEGRILTLQRPEAISARILYAGMANLLIGTIGSIIIVRTFIRSSLSHPESFGFTTPRRTVVSVLIATVIEVSLLFIQRMPSWDPIILLNGFAQTLVVSIAEVLVWWAVLSVSVASLRIFENKIASIAMGLVASAIAFGIYHFAHSPPFNTLRMVVLLTIVGLFSGLYFFLSRNVYGTIVFHNFLALTGVTQTLADSGRLQAFAQPRLPLLLTGIVVVAILILADLKIIRSALRILSLSDTT